MMFLGAPASPSARWCLLTIPCQVVNQPLSAAMVMDGYQGCTCRALRTREHEAASVRAQDAVPRASLHTASRLQDEIVEALARGRRCKARTLP